MRIKWRIGIALCAWAGVGLQLYKHGWHMMLYYTILSNILAAVWSSYMVIRQRQHGSGEGAHFVRIKAGVTLALMLTMLVYHVLLAPTVSNHLFYTAENFLCHYIVPSMLWFDWLIWDKRGQYCVFDPLLWCIVPIGYAVFGLMNGLIFKIMIPNNRHSPFPYFFLDVSQYGVMSVVQYVCMIAIAYIMLGYVMYGVKYRRNSMSSERLN